MKNTSTYISLLLTTLLVACGALKGGDAPTSSATTAADAHHVVDGSGRQIGDSYKECVNTGHSENGHGGACGGQAGVAAATATPAPVLVESAPTPAPSTSAVVEEKKPEVTRGEVVHEPGLRIDQLALQADALFHFARSDSASMLPAGKKQLDALAARISGMDRNAISQIQITGHADRLGGTAANLALSQRRAQTVLDYLESKGVDRGLMQSIGKGESMPVVDCKGERATAQLKACLAANRRVEVVVFGR